MIRKIVLEKPTVKKKHCILNEDVYNERDQISKINQLYLKHKRFCDLNLKEIIINDLQERVSKSRNFFSSTRKYNERTFKTRLAHLKG